MISSLPSDLLWNAAIFLAAAGLGRRALRALRLEVPDSGTTWLFALGLGLTLLALGVAFLVKAGLVYFIVFSVSLAVLCLAGLGDIRRFFSEVRSSARDWNGSLFSRFSGWSAIDLVLIGWVVLAFTFHLVSVYAPPTSSREMFLDFTIPKFLLFNRGLPDLPFPEAGYRPLFPHALTLFAMTLRADSTAKLLHYGLALASLAALFFWARARAGSLPAWMAAAVFSWLLPLAWMADSASSDFLHLFLGLLALSAASSWARSGSRRYLGLAWFFAGSAGGAAAAGLAAPAAVFLFQVGMELRSGGAPAQAAKRLALGLVFGAVGLAPWLWTNPGGWGFDAAALLKDAGKQPGAYALPAAVLSLFAGGAWLHFRSLFGRRYWTDAALLSALAGLAAISGSFSGLRKAPVFLGLQSRESFLKREIPLYETIAFANGRFYGMERILVLGGRDTAGYYWNGWMIPARAEILRASGTEPVVGLLENTGITHVLIFDHRAPPHFWDLGGLARTHFIEMYRGADAALYRVEYLDRSNQG